MRIVWLKNAQKLMSVRCKNEHASEAGLCRLSVWVKAEHPTKVCTVPRRSAFRCPVLKTSLINLVVTHFVTTISGDH